MALPAQRARGTQRATGSGRCSPRAPPPAFSACRQPPRRVRQPSLALACTGSAASGHSSALLRARCCAPTRPRARGRLACAASAASSSGEGDGGSSSSEGSGSSSSSEGSRSGDAPTRKTLPIFPLNVVALPHAVVPLLIFEARYRVLFSTLLAGSPDVDTGLVQEESPFAGTKRFGMCYFEGGRLSAIGTTLEINHFVRESTGRMYVTNKGIERFRITKVVTEAPVLLCEVEVLPEDDDQSDEAKKLASEVAELFRNVLRLHLKMNRARLGGGRGGGGGGGGGSGGALDSAEAEDEALEAAELTDYSPSQLSFWIAHAFTDSKYTQQALLEEDSTLVRLTEERSLLSSTLSYYSAKMALKGVFSSSSSETPQPPPGGPD